MHPPYSVYGKTMQGWKVTVSKTGQESTNENWDRNKVERQRETQNDKRDKKMTTRDKILKFVIILSLAVIFLSRLSFCVSLCFSILFLSQFSFVLSCPVSLSTIRIRLQKIIKCLGHFKLKILIVLTWVVFGVKQ